MTSDLEVIARRYVWWEPPAVALSRRDHFLCQLMTLGTAEDVRTVRGAFGDAAFVHALAHATPGVMDPKSWNFWHLVFGIQPIPRMPERAMP